MAASRTNINRARGRTASLATHFQQKIESSARKEAVGANDSVHPSNSQNSSKVKLIQQRLSVPVTGTPKKETSVPQPQYSLGERKAMWLKATEKVPAKSKEEKIEQIRKEIKETKIEPAIYTQNKNLSLDFTIPPGLIPDGGEYALEKWKKDDATGSLALTTKAVFHLVTGYDEAKNLSMFIIRLVRQNASLKSHFETFMQALNSALQFLHSSKDVLLSFLDTGAPLLHAMNTLQELADST